MGKLGLGALVFLLASFARAQTQFPASTAGTELVQRTTPSVALLLVGEAGSTQEVAVGLIVRSDGVLLTTYHAVKEARAVQVRLNNGETFDRVQLIAYDERRDMAALRISGTALPTVPTSGLADIRAGQEVYLISHAAGPTWTATAGIISGTRMADEIPGAGQGYRLVEFTAPIAPESSGGVLVDAQGRALGIAVGTLAGGQNRNFAVPLESVLGLAQMSGGTTFASAAGLVPSTQQATLSVPSPRRGVRVFRAPASAPEARPSHPGAILQGPRAFAQTGGPPPVVPFGNNVTVESPDNPFDAPMTTTFLIADVTHIDKKIWMVEGRVTRLNGDPAGSVPVQIEFSANVLPSMKLMTNLQGEFKAEVILGPELKPLPAATLVASKEGYLEARETIDLSAGKVPAEIILVLREPEESDQLRLAELTSALAPRLRSSAAPGPQAEKLRKDYTRGLEVLLTKGQAAEALPVLSKVVEKEPSCLECNLAAGLATLNTDAWGSARQYLTRAALRDRELQPKERRPEPFLLLGVLESWRHQYGRSTALLAEAVQIAPSDPWALQELGRSLVHEQNWGVAEQYLAKAIRAGAPADSHFLRAQALLGAGDLMEADVELKTYIGGRDLRQLPNQVRVVMGDLHRRVDLAGYKKGGSVLNQPIEELVKAIPGLKELQPAPSQEELPLILQRTGEQVESFFRDFVNCVAVERIQEKRLKPDGSVKGENEEKFDYLLYSPKGKLDEVGFQEYRTGPDGKMTDPAGLKKGYMVTAGFTGNSLKLHPLYQAGASFRYLGHMEYQGRATYVVVFAQRPETAQLIGSFNADNFTFQLLVQGVAWIDASSFQILRLRTELLGTPPKSRLAKRTTDIEYAEAHFKELARPVWMPRQVTVIVEWKGRMFQNEHLYSDYKYFKVGAEEKRRATQLPPGEPDNPN